MSNFHKLGVSQINYTNQINLSVIPVKENRHGKHKNPNYYQEYYLKNREKLLSYSHDYYGVKKLLKEAENKAKIGVKKISFTGTHDITFSNIDKELFFGGVRGTGKEEILKCLDVARIRLATKNKVAQKKYWNYPWFKEWLNKEKLLSKYQEWGIRGGQKIGNKFLSFLDVDIEKESLEEWRKRQLRKNTRFLLDYLDCFHVETKKGFHVYLLTDYLLPNSLLYHVDSWKGTQKVIGSIQSKGKYVVGFDSLNKKLIEKGKWFWHVKDIDQVKEILGKFFLLVRNPEKLNIGSDFKLSPKTNQVRGFEQLKSERVFIQAQILGRHKVPSLEDMWKIFYRDQQNQQKGFFFTEWLSKTPYFEWIRGRE